MGMSYRFGFGAAFNCGAEFGVDEERPEHLVIRSKPFYLAETEVTVGQFKQFVAATIDQLVETTKSGGHSLRTLITAIVRTEAFQTK